jgi:hypothetical protein
MSTLLESWGTSLILAFDNLASVLVNFVPKFILAVVIFMVGWLIGAIIGRFIAQVVNMLRVNRALEEVGVGEVVARAGMKLDAGRFIGKIVEYFVVIVFLIASLELMGLTQVTTFLKEAILVNLLPNVIVATLILVIAAVVADAVKRLVTSSFRAAGISSAGFMGGIAKWAIWGFALIAALAQLGIAEQMLLTLFTGFVAMLAIAGGLAFGLGGKDAAASFIERLREDISTRS